MTDQYTKGQVDFYDEENEVVEEGMDPKNAEQQSITSVDKAGEVTKQAPKRKGDKDVGDKKAPSTKAGMLNAAFTKMNSLTKSEMAELYGRMFAEDMESEEVKTAIQAEDTDYDFSEDLNALVESEATLSEEFKQKTAIIFEAAVKAIETLDQCVSHVIAACENSGGTCLITADHGNAEQMRDPDTGQPHTAHTVGPVPVWLANPPPGVVALTAGALQDVAPTILGLLSLPVTSAMTGHSLLVRA